MTPTTFLSPSREPPAKVLFPDRERNLPVVTHDECKPVWIRVELGHAFGGLDDAHVRAEVLLLDEVAARHAGRSSCTLGHETLADAAGAILLWRGGLDNARQFGEQQAIRRAANANALVGMPWLD